MYKMTKERYSTFSCTTARQKKVLASINKQQRRGKTITRPYSNVISSLFASDEAVFFPLDILQRKTAHPRLYLPSPSSFALSHLLLFLKGRTVLYRPPCCLSQSVNKTKRQRPDCFIRTIPHAMSQKDKNPTTAFKFHTLPSSTSIIPKSQRPKNQRSNLPGCAVGYLLMFRDNRQRGGCIISCRERRVKFSGEQPRRSSR